MAEHNPQSSILNPPSKLHLGSGPQRLEGWLNVDNLPYPGVDRVLDVTAGLPFEDVQFIFAEHFIEHLQFDAAVALMRECRRVLRDEGVLRLRSEERRVGKGGRA